jgi:hypothetical protein
MFFKRVATYKDKEEGVERPLADKASLLELMWSNE